MYIYSYRITRIKYNTIDKTNYIEPIFKIKYFTQSPVKRC